MPPKVIIIGDKDGLEQYKDHASNLLYQYYENSPTALDIHRVLTQQEKDELAEATMYNIMATQNHKEK